MLRIGALVAALVGAAMTRFMLLWAMSLTCLACAETPGGPDAGLPAQDAAIDDGGDAGVQDATVAPDAGAGGCGGGSVCPDGEVCSVYGECFSGECLVHGDCAPSERCHQGQCLNRPNPEFGILFERPRHGIRRPPLDHPRVMSAAAPRPTETMVLA